MSPKTDTQKSAKSATVTGKAVKGFTDEERAAMKERVQELKAEARRGPRAKRADGESDLFAQIAKMPERDRAMAERLHAIIKASAPALSPRTWYGMPAYAKDGSSASSRARTSSRRGTRRSASASRRHSMKVPCGRSPSRSRH